MPKSLAELRASDQVGLPERAYSLCLAAKLVAEVQQLNGERDTLVVRSQVDEDGNRVGPPSRLGQGQPERIHEIETRLAELFDEMDEHTGELRLRAWTNGDWRRWVDEHPARPEGIKGHDRDEIIAFGLCNADALQDSMGDFAVSWNGEPLKEGDWQFIANRATGGDLNAIAQIVVAMHETAADLGKLRSASLGNLRSANGHSSPSPLESPRDDSTDGSPESSTSTSTTTPDV